MDLKDSLRDTLKKSKELISESKKQFSDFADENQNAAMELAKILNLLLENSNESRDFFDWFRMSKSDTQVKVEKKSLVLKEQGICVEATEKVGEMNVPRAKILFSENTMRALKTYLEDTVGGFYVVIGKEENSPYWECWIHVL